MKKISLVLSLIILSIGLFGCQQNNEEKVDNAPSNTEGIEKITIYQLENTSKTMVIEDNEAIRTIKEAVNSAEKEPGIVNMTDPEFKIESGKESYFLWISEDSGTIMNAKDTHIIYSLSESSIKQVNELILGLKK